MLNNGEGSVHAVAHNGWSKFMTGFWLISAWHMVYLLFAYGSCLINMWLKSGQYLISATLWTIYLPNSKQHLGYQPIFFRNKMSKTRRMVLNSSKPTYEVSTLWIYAYQPKTLMLTKKSARRWLISTSRSWCHQLTRFTKNTTNCYHQH